MIHRVAPLVVPKYADSVRMKGCGLIALYEADGTLVRESEVYSNVVATLGRSQLFLLAASTLFVGLLDGTPTVVVGDTMASHAGWTEVTSYDEAARQAYVPASVASGTVNNSASRARFNFSGSATVGGLGMFTDSTKGGATGTFISGVAATGGDETPTAGQYIDAEYELVIS